MPRKYVLELICDYLAACRTYGMDPNYEYLWWRKNENELKMHSETKDFINTVFFAIYCGHSLKDAVKAADIDKELKNKLNK